MKIKRLNTGDVAIGTDGDILYTGGIGSCVVICLWDSNLRIGGMAHMPLPSSKDSVTREWFSIGIAPDIALPYLVDKLKQRGSRHEELTLRLVGGGNMFSDISNFNDVGGSILKATNALSQDMGLLLLKSCTGGKFGKSAEFNIGTGTIIVNHTNGFSEQL